MENNGRKKILVAPLNWGLGHATRCIPIIKALLDYNFEPIIASDGDALELLKKEFPELNAIELPSYNITYPKKGKGLRKKLLSDSPRFMKTIKKERRLIKLLAETEGLSGIISDNRFGVRAKDIPTIFITHQLKVLSGSTTWLSTKLHQNIISKFDECWVPDHKGANNLSGDLGHGTFDKIQLKYIGPLSRFQKQKTNKIYDLIVLLSGPEPQRTILEQKLLNELEHFNGNVRFVRGLIKNSQTKQTQNNLTVYNYMTTQELEKSINESALVLSRSGYTTIMDLAKLEKKAFFIPTPGQFEQEYLARRLKDDKIIPSCNQDDFKIEMLNSIEDYSGFKSSPFQTDYENLFSLF
ncbi:glycosyltransferase [Winogradskyella vincentii]|uniref:Glycosyltransferase n=1 Tax=Winogradskyella vincentii TaxID=2877122 RepID=A0ABS7XWV6_9FLAO|nr:glycosyltransferase [Winogradskyella vincentii]MCA0152123.1 glycosyltransferase [Winogradskyella vincentii]